MTSLHLNFIEPLGCNLTTPVLHCDGAAFVHYNFSLYIRNLVCRDWKARISHLTKLVEFVQTSQSGLGFDTLQGFINSRMKLYLRGSAREVGHVILMDSTKLPHEQFAGTNAGDAFKVYWNLLRLALIMDFAPDAKGSTQYRRTILEQASDLFYTMWDDHARLHASECVTPDWWRADVVDDLGRSRASILLPGKEDHPQTQEFLSTLNPEDDYVSSFAQIHRAFGLVEPDPRLKDPVFFEKEKAEWNNLEAHTRSKKDSEYLIEVPTDEVIETLFSETMDELKAEAEKSKAEAKAAGGHGRKGGRGKK